MFCLLYVCAPHECNVHEVKKRELYGCWESNPVPLEEQFGLTPEPSHQQTPPPPIVALPLCELGQVIKHLLWINYAYEHFSSKSRLSFH